jgi:hypothetical protein
MKIYYRCSPEIAEKILEDGFTNRALGNDGTLMDHGIDVSDHPYKRTGEEPRKVILEFELSATGLDLFRATLDERRISCDPAGTCAKRTDLSDRFVRVSWLYERIRDVRMAPKPVLLMRRPEPKSTDDLSSQRTDSS